MSWKSQGRRSKTAPESWKPYWIEKSRFVKRRPHETCMKCSSALRVAGDMFEEMFCTHAGTSGPCDANRRFFSKEGSYGTVAEVSNFQLGQSAFKHGPWATSSAVIGTFTEEDPVGVRTFGEEGYIGWRGQGLKPGSGGGKDFRPKAWMGAAWTQPPGNGGNHPGAGMLPGAGYVIRSPGFSFDARPGTEKWASGHYFANQTQEMPLREMVLSRPFMGLPPLGQRPGLYGSGRAKP